MSAASEYGSEAHIKSLAERQYEIMLQVMIAMLGTDDLTNSSQLHAAMKKLFPGKHVAVGAKSIPTEKPGYYILNLMEVPGGSHWVALVVEKDGKRYFYDSFARTAKSLGIKEALDAELDAEQRVDENNCGQRCLAFLFMFENLGWDYAQWI